ncbi:hypothetical protein TcYC6_0103800 [Trypanosoma cruzi]|nr:hypothetical protein TcYC6_0103800 [Trypanosoma cruzi]
MKTAAEHCLAALIDSVGSGGPIFRREAIGAIAKLSQNGTSAVLRFCVTWLNEHGASSTPVIQRCGVVCAMATIVGGVGDEELSTREAIALLQCGIREMTVNSDLTSELSKEALRLVVGLCVMFPAEGCRELLSSLGDNTLPHFYVLLAISHLAEKVPERILPYVKEFLTRLLPPLGIARQDNHRMLLSRACGSLAEALVKMRFDARSPLEEYNDLMYSTLNFFLGDYSRCNERRVRTLVVYAVGCVFGVCGDEKRMELAGKVAPLVIYGVRREKGHDVLFPLRGLVGFFSYVTDGVRSSLRPFVEGTLQAIMQTLEHLGAEDVETKEEIFAVIMAISDSFVAEVLAYLSAFLEAKKELHLRCAAVFILRMLVLQSRNQKLFLQPFVNDIVATVKLALGSHEDSMVRRAVVECILTICSSEADFASAVGYSDMLSYLIHCASLHDDVDEGLIAVRDISRNGLMLVASSKGALDSQLWPFIFEHMREYPAKPFLLCAFSAICNVITQLASRISHNSSCFYVDFSRHVNVPSPGMLVSVFLSQSMLIGFYRVEELLTILEAALSVAPLIDDPYAQSVEEGGGAAMPITELWSTFIPSLQQLLTTEPAREVWEVEVERLVDKTLKVKQSEEWAMHLTTECLSLLQAYQQDARMFRSALIIVGIGCSRTASRDLIASAVETAVNASNHDDPEHVIGLAKCLGYVAKKHVDTALETLCRLAKGAEKRGFFHSREKTKRVFVEGSRSVAAVGFGYACKCMEIAALPSRLDTVVFPSLLTLLREGHTPQCQISLFEGCRIVGTAIARLDSYFFKCRDEFILSFVRFMQMTSKKKTKEETNPTAFAALESIVSCTLLPPLGDNGTAALIELVKVSVTECHMVNAEKDVNVTNLFVQVLRHRDCRYAMRVLGELAPLTVLENDGARCLAVKLVVTVLAACRASRESGADGSAEQPHTLVSMGCILGRLVPRMMDRCPSVRMEAANGIVSGIQTARLFMETPQQMEEEVTEEILKLGKRAHAFVDDGTLSSEKEAVSVVKSMCTILAQQLQQREDTTALIKALLFNSIFDTQKYAATGACITMHGLIRGCGGVLDASDVREVFDGLIAALQRENLPEQVRSGVQTSIRNLTRHHVAPCFVALLRSQLPHSEAVINSFGAIANDTTLGELLVQHILDFVLNSPTTIAAAPTANKPSDLQVVSPIVLSAVCAVGWVAQTDRGASVCRNHRASLYMAIVLHLSVCHRMNDHDAVVMSGTAFKHVTCGTVDDVTVVRFDRYGWKNFFEKQKYLLAIAEAVRYWCREGLGDSNEMDRGKAADADGRFPMEPAEPTQLTHELAKFMLPYCSHVSPTHRKAAACVCSELIAYALGDEELVRSLVTALLSMTGCDEEAETRETIIGGMANILVHPYASIHGFVPPILSATLACMEQQHTSLAAKSMDVVALFAEVLEDKSFINGSFVTIATKLRSFFEHDDAQLRAKSFDCLRRLYSLAHRGILERASVNQNVFPYVIPMLIHLGEHDMTVSTAAKAALHECLTFISVFQHEAGEQIVRMLSKPHMRTDRETDIDDIYDDVASTWVSHFHGMMREYVLQAVTFTRSPNEALRQSAARILGAFIRCIPRMDLSRCGVEQVSASLVELVGTGEKSEIVRVAAARAIGCFASI